MTPAKQAAMTAIESLGLSIRSVFIPFSQSRNKDSGWQSLNWRVTLVRNGRDVITTDYSAGAAHCPAAAKRAPTSFRAMDRALPPGQVFPGTSSRYRRPTESERLSDYLAAWRAAECESGFAMEHSPFLSDADLKIRRTRQPGEQSSKATPILPDVADVLYSLVSDSRVLDSGGFEEWASDCGYDADSRSAEVTYRACLEIALKLRAAIGEAGLETLQTAFEDY